MSDVGYLAALMHRVGEEAIRLHGENSVGTFCCAALCGCGCNSYTLSDEPGGAPIGQYYPGKIAKKLQELGAERHFFLQVKEPGGRRHYYLEAAWVTRERPCEAEDLGTVVDEGPFSVLLVDCGKLREEIVDGEG